MVTYVVGFLNVRVDEVASRAAGFRDVVGVWGARGTGDGAMVTYVLGFVDVGGFGDGAMVAYVVDLAGIEFVNALSLRSLSSRLIGVGANGAVESTRFRLDANVGLGLTVGSRGGETAFFW